MYRRTKQYVKSEDTDPNIFIDGFDYNNSELLYRLDEVTEYEIYTVTKYEHRPDLISLDIYNDVKYEWIILYVNKITVDDLVRGLKLRYIPKSDLINLMSKV